MSENVVEKVVNNELDMTAGLISGVKNFAVTKGVDIFQAIIIFSIGYMICCWLRGVVRRLLARSNVEPSAISFISEIIFFLCLAGVIIMALVYDYSVSVSVLVAQQFAVNGAETLTAAVLQVAVLSMAF